MTNLGGVAIGIAIIAIIIAGASLAISQNQQPVMTTSTAAKSEPVERTIYMTLVEKKGSTSVEKEPFPTVALPTGEGYELKAPDESGNWVVETYAFSPSVIIVNQGDTVKIQMLGINGALHHISIENYVDAFDIHRGELQEISFVADKPGSFRISCSIHQPAMEGYLMVLTDA